MALYTFADKGGQSVTAQQLDSNFSNLQNQIAALIGGTALPELEALAAETQANADQVTADKTTVGGYVTTAAGSATAAASSAATFALLIGADGFILKDSNNLVYCIITPTTISHPDFDAVKANANAAAAIAAYMLFSSGPAAQRFVDSNQKLWASFAPNNQRFAALDKVSADLTRTRMRATFGELSSIPSLGQSTDIGYQSLSALTTTALPYAYKFSGGVRPGDAQGITDCVIATAFAAVVPFLEANAALDGGGTAFGETPCGGFLTMLYQMLLSENGIDLTAETRSRFITAACGHNSYTANQLYTTPALDRMKATVQYGKSVGEGTGLRFHGAPALLAFQGENDYSSGTASATWMATWRNIRAALAAENLTRIGRTLEPVVFFGQTSTHINYSVATPNIALAQLAFELEAYFGRIFPTYQLAYYTDGVHFTNVSSMLVGAMQAIQVKRRLIDGDDGVGIRAGAGVISGGNTVTIPISWIQGSRGNALTVDTSPGAVANYGWELYDVSNAAVTITGVTVNSTSVQLTYSSGAPTQWRYAWQGNTKKGIGQIRDNEPLFYRGSDGKGYPMYNFLPISQGAVA